MVRATLLTCETEVTVRRYRLNFQFKPAQICPTDLTQVQMQMELEQLVIQRPQNELDLNLFFPYIKINSK